MGDVRRELTFCRKTGLKVTYVQVVECVESCTLFSILTVFPSKVLGIVENMSGYVCPHCSTCTNVFSSGGGRALAEHAKASHKCEEAQNPI